MMKSNNQYLREIAINFGVNIPNEHKSNNWYLKKIKEALESDNND